MMLTRRVGFPDCDDRARPTSGNVCGPYVTGGLWSRGAAPGRTHRDEHLYGDYRGPLGGFVFY